MTESRSPLDDFVDAVREFAAALEGIDASLLVGPHKVAEKLRTLADQAVSHVR